MDARKIALGTIAYTIGTFSLAVGWHVLLFEESYQSFGYFEGEPNFLIGLGTIVIQGIILSVIFPLVRLSGSNILRGLKFAALIGVFFWTSHVLAFIAKQTVDHVFQFVMMESFYLVLQFGLFGVLIGTIYNDDSAT